MAKKDDLNKREEIEEEINEEELEEVEDEMNLENEGDKEEDLELTKELQEDYGYPEPEQKHNAHVIISRTLDSVDTVRTTFLTESELGRPTFSVRFLSDLHDESKRHGLIRIENYFWEKIQNITNSGMSKIGRAHV